MKKQDKVKTIIAVLFLIQFSINIISQNQCALNLQDKMAENSKIGDDIDKDNTIEIQSPNKNDIDYTWETPPGGEIPPEHEENLEYLTSEFSNTGSYTTIPSNWKAVDLAISQNFFCSPYSFYWNYWNEEYSADIGNLSMNSKFNMKFETCPELSGVDPSFLYPDGESLTINPEEISTDPYSFIISSGSADGNIEELNDDDLTPVTFAAFGFFKNYMIDVSFLFTSPFDPYIYYGPNSVLRIQISNPYIPITITQGGTSLFTVPVDASIKTYEIPITSFQNLKISKSSVSNFFSFSIYSMSYDTKCTKIPFSSTYPSTGLENIMNYVIYAKGTRSFEDGAVRFLTPTSISPLITIPLTADFMEYTTSANDAGLRETGMLYVYESVEIDYFAHRYLPDISNFQVSLQLHHYYNRFWETNEIADFIIGEPYVDNELRWGWRKWDINWNWLSPSDGVPYDPITNGWPRFMNVSFSKTFNQRSILGFNYGNLYYDYSLYDFFLYKDSAQIKFNFLFEATISDIEFNVEMREDFDSRPRIINYMENEITRFSGSEPIKHHFAIGEQEFQLYYGYAGDFAWDLDWQFMIEAKVHYNEMESDPIFLYQQPMGYGGWLTEWGKWTIIDFSSSGDFSTESDLIYGINAVVNPTNLPLNDWFQIEYIYTDLIGANTSIFVDVFYDNTLPFISYSPYNNQILDPNEILTFIASDNNILSLSYTFDLDGEFSEWCGTWYSIDNFWIFPENEWVTLEEVFTPENFILYNFSIDPSVYNSLSEGPHRIFIKAEDGINQGFVDPIEFDRLICYKDTLFPDASINTPQNFDICDPNTLDIQVSAFDANLRVIYWRFDDESMFNSADRFDILSYDRFEYNQLEYTIGGINYTSLCHGEHYLQLAIGDVVGHFIYIGTWVYIDKNFPDISILDDYSYIHSNEDIQFSITDNATITSLSYLFGDDVNLWSTEWTEIIGEYSFSPNELGQFIIGIPSFRFNDIAEDQKIYLEISTTDIFGNSHIYAYEFIKDSISPTLSQSDPGAYHASDFTITYNIQELNFAAAKFYINGIINETQSDYISSEFLSNTNPITITIFNQERPDGIYEIKLEIIDKASNWNFIIFNFELDTGLEFEIISPSVNGIVGPNVQFILNASGDVIAKLEVKIGGRSYVPLDDSEFIYIILDFEPYIGTEGIIFTLFADTYFLAADFGQIVFSLRLTDLANNNEIHSITLNRDPSAPVLTITAPKQNLLFGSDSMQYAISVADDHLKEYGIIGPEGQKLPLGVFNGQAAVNISPEGTIPENYWVLYSTYEGVFLFYAIDALGQETQTGITVRIDKTPPELKILGPVANTKYMREPPLLVIEVNDDYLKLVYYEIGDKQFIMESDSAIIDAEAWELAYNQTVTITVYAQDDAGNFIIQTVTVIREDYDPTRRPNALPEQFTNVPYTMIIAFGIAGVASFVVGGYNNRSKYRATAGGK